MSVPSAFEHYEILRRPDGSPVELGRGAMGVTYKAFDKNLRCHVALKAITASLLENELAAERFMREARAAAQVRHRNVASVFHLGRHGDNYFYAMEFIEGETVEAVVTRDGPLDCAFALEIAQQVATALIAADKQQIVHRDIKPANLMLVHEDDDEMLVKVIDFGLVKSTMIDSTGMGGLTTHGFVGTPAFASPEQLEGQTEDVRSDIYSLGATLWYMLMASPPFTGSVASVISQHLVRRPPFDSLAAVPAVVVTVLGAMLEKDKTRRVQTPSQLRAALRACIERLGATGTTPVADVGPETMAYQSNLAGPDPPRAGLLLKERYRLIEDLKPVHPGQTFSAEDEIAKMRVLVRIYPLLPTGLAQVQEKAARVAALAHPNIARVFAVEEGSGFGFAVFEWLQGFPLGTLLRARLALPLGETLVLLEQIAAGVDAACAAGLNLGSTLPDVFLHFPEGMVESSAEALTARPLHEWRRFVVKLNAVDQTTETRALAEPLPDIVRVGTIVYQILGGTPDNFLPFPGITRDGNEILRRCVTPRDTFPTARAFYEALKGTLPPRTEVHPAGRTGTEPGARRPLTPPTTQLPARTATPVRGTSGRPRPARRFLRFLGLATAVLFALGLLLAGGWLAFFAPNLFPSPSARRGPGALPPPSTSLPHPLVSSVNRPKRLPLTKGQPWINSLEMRFVPLENSYLGVWQTRVRDFDAFVQNTGYDAVGGMSSAVTRDGVKRSVMSWKNPGFAQSPEHPVVGVSWEDASQFCAWLTQKEHETGVLPPLYRYRLPSDREWSTAVGLSEETGATPEDRDGNVYGVYPWGRTFPPPNDVVNYAGRESREGAPEDWAVIPGFHDAFPRTAPVSASGPNPRGVCNLGGNVWEWCLDRFNATRPWRTLRGGSWATWRRNELLSSSRRGGEPYFRSDDVGFRCVISANEGQK